MSQSIDEFSLISKYFKELTSQQDVAVGIGDDAAIINISKDHQIAVATDTLVASADAYLNALNKLIIKRKKTAPEPMDLSGSKYIREKDGTI